MTNKIFQTSKKATILISLTFMLVLFSLSLTSAVNECGNDNSFLGTFRQNITITLKQTCDDCSYVNLSSVTYPNSTTIVYNTNMTKSGIEFSRILNTTRFLGCYSYVVYGDKGGTLTSETIDFQITPSGTSGNSNLVFFIFLIVGLYTLNLVGFFKGNEVLTMLSALIMMALGVYIINQGIFVYRDWLTNAIAYITIGWGFVSFGVSAYNWYENM